MGFFQQLFGGGKPANCDILPDKIWMTADGKFAGIAKDVTIRSKKGTTAILLVAHFPDLLARLDEIAAAPHAVPVKAVLAANLSPNLADGLNLDKFATIDIIIAERHPLASADQRLETFAGSLPCRCRLAHHLSLDDPLMQAFAGEWVRNVLGKMGMTEDESIESTMVTRRIKGAQKQIESQSTGRDLAANSAAVWLERNCQNLRFK